MRLLMCLLAGLCALMLNFGSARAEERVIVFAAASLQDALEAVFDEVGVEATVSYGGSGVIARQIAQGAPADIVILANALWMDWLQEAGRIATGTRLDLLGNVLVIVGPAGAVPLADVSDQTLIKRLDGRRMAIGHTQAVPAGIYAREWMERTGIWVEMASQLAETENVRAALALVARQEVPLGVVYVSDAQVEPAVDVVWSIDPTLHGPIVYPIAVVEGQARPEVMALAEALQSAAAADVFRAFGFRPMAGAE